jgi:uncharacterized protein
MRCPIDQSELVMSERQGIEIDYCPTCRGVWLDRGELDKLVERAAAYESGARGRYDDDRDRDRNDDRRRYDDDDDDYRRRGGTSERVLGEVKELVGRRREHDSHGGYDSHGRPRRKKRSFLEDILDF